jgi:MoxR-like ATPase
VESIYKMFAELEPGQIAEIGGRPGTGKTRFIERMVDYIV